MDTNITFIIQDGDRSLNHTTSNQNTLLDVIEEVLLLVPDGGLKLYLNDKLLDNNTKICDSGITDGCTIDTSTEWSELDARFQELKRLKRLSDEYREVKLYMCILAKNLNVVTGNIKYGYTPIRLKKTPTSDHSDHQRLISPCLLDGYIIREEDDNSPYRQYRKAVIEFLEAGPDSYIGHKYDKIVSALQFNNIPYSYTVRARRRALITEAKYLYAMTNLNVFFIDEDDIRHRVEGYMNDKLEHIDYLRLIRSLMKLIDKNRLAGIRPIIGNVYHNITFMPTDLSEYIDEDPYYLYDDNSVLQDR